jgi:anti-sigma regulatory factor (Ser/Thr protein kinase)
MTAQPASTTIQEPRMDWYLHPGDTAGVPRLRRQIMDYLARTAAPGADLAGTEVVVGELLSNAVAHTPGPAWVNLQWDGEHPRLRITDIGDGPADLIPALPADPLSDGGRGLYLVSRLARELAVSRHRRGGTEVAAVLDICRA